MPGLQSKTLSLDKVFIVIFSRMQANTLRHRRNLSDTTARPQLCLQLTRDSAKKGGVGFCDFQRAPIGDAIQQAS
jgi:hypothetical protein